MEDAFTPAAWPEDVEEEAAFKILIQKINALRQTEDRLKPVFGNDLRLTIIDSRAVAAAESQWQPIFNSNEDIASRYYHTWDQQDFLPESLDETYLKNYIGSFRYPDRFNVAVWKGDTLCGVACGGYKGEIDRDFISIMLREAHPDPNHPLKGKIGPIIHEAAETYAQSLGVSRICYIGPYSKGAIKVHESMGLIKEKIMVREGQITEAYTKHLTDRAVPQPAASLSIQPH